jgi:tripartite-type tricarboxylate transporter receptor subunit TctC
VRPHRHAAHRDRRAGGAALTKRGTTLKIMRKLSGGLAALAVLALAASGAASAQEFPDKTVRVIVPFPPGGGTDTLGRILAQKLSESWKQPVVVDNRPGASGMIGAEAVMKAPADGYTLLMASTGTILSLASREKGPPGAFDVTKDLAPVTLVAAPPYLLVVNPSVPAKSTAEFVAYAKQHPGDIAFGSSGIGAASHLAGELFNSMAGVELLHVPYKGTGQALTDLLGGQVSAMFGPAPTVIAQVQSGKLRVLGSTGAERSKLFPDIPTIAESGVPGYEAVGWFGLFAPAGTPAPVLAKINADAVRLLNTPDVVQRLAQHGAEPAGMSADAFRDYVNRDTRKWLDLAQRAHIELQGQ